MAQDGKSMRTVISCALTTFFMGVASGSYVTVFGFLPEYVGSDLVGVGLATSIFGIFMMLSGLFAA